MHKCRGEKKALTQIVKSMKEYGYHGGKVRISHSYNPEAADRLAEMIIEIMRNFQTRISPLPVIGDFAAIMQKREAFWWDLKTFWYKRE